MEMPHYPMVVSEDRLTYEFFSDGPKGKILKSIWYEPLQTFSLVFNLALGDVDNDMGDIRCDVVSNNNDRDKVLRTVAESVIVLCRFYPSAYVVFQGNSPARTRLYRMMLSKHLSEIRQRFWVFGILRDRTEPFRKNKNYRSFMVKAK
ncbi:DUF6934 family protein [Chryseolinea lacunae]|uniref:DUF695 domain-containing protein n=1 Tax=Chryseolinea lacunae TaxID=2801331 RepID=A0ABS1KKE4_9BACT|nr:hypothetical protein [Chryseolinea lacunae]MBL0739820.1 hypothetical protein [Chryseolinea lacunae]